MNRKELAIKISKKEGKKTQVDIAQISEILKLVLSELKKLSLKELTSIIG